MRPMKNAAGFLFLILLLAPLPARAADCFRECMDASGCWSSRSDENVSYCSSINARCSTECRNAAPDNSYGAIAYSIKDGAYGFSDSFKNRKQAEKTALTYCSKYGAKCEVMVWFYNSCGAVAADGKKAGWGQADTQAEAIKKALAKCKKAGGKNCKIKTSHCSS